MPETTMPETLNLTRAAGRAAGAAYAARGLRDGVGVLDVLDVLEALRDFREFDGNDWGVLIYDDGRAYSAAETIYCCIAPDDAGSRSFRRASEAWWAAACPEHDAGAWHETEFVDGFIDGALEVADEDDRSA
jgi:hypothetical protein